jgi:hypothetical protein
MNRSMVLGTLLISLWPGFAYQVRVNFDPEAHFARYKTYRLVHSTGAQSAPLLFPDQLIAGFVEERLAARGLKRVTPGADLLISYRFVVAEYPRKINLSDGVGPTGLGWGDTTYTALVRPIQEGTLVIDMVDARKNHIVFEGISSLTVSSSPQKNTKKLAGIVREILESFPPRP